MSITSATNADTSLHTFSTTHKNTLIAQTCKVGMTM